MSAADPRHQFGQVSEMRAEQFLIAKGYRILDRNVRLSIGELDLVADDQGVVVFVEVKGRSTDAFGGARLAVDHRKRAKLSKLAAQYLAQRRWSDKLCRFDVILIQGQASSLAQIEHIPNAFDVTEE
ncbi:MAG TPA: YraN family protein [Nitrospira sp.]|nr:YraN family protein [Nitrospira sp.]